MFRKVADVKREKELAEKRKNEPPLELASDHPVRKLISRFRKISDNRGGQGINLSNTDAEKGQETPLNNVATPKANGGAGGGTATRIINVSENSKGVSVKTGKGATPAAKWGKFLAATAAPAGAGAPEIPAPTPAAPAKNTSQNNATPAPAKKVSKWGKLLGTPQDTIEEEDETKKSNGNKKSDATDKGTKLELVPLQPHSEEPAPLTSRDIQCTVPTAGSGGGGAFTPVEQQLIASLYDIKLEIKEEIESLNQKMTKIDDQIGDILKMFTPNSSPFSSHTPSLSSRVHSSASGTVSSGGNSSCNSSVGSNITSPKGSVPSSPHRQPADTVQSPQRSNNAASKSPFRKSSRPSPPPGESSSDRPDSAGGSSTSSKGSANARRRKAGSAGRKRVAPSDMDTTVLGTAAAAADDEHTHIKDRDLDIL